MPVKEYLSKIVAVTAIQIEDLEDADHIAELEEFCGAHIEITPKGQYQEGLETPVDIWNHMSETWMGASEGDFIIKGLDEEFFPVSQYSLEKYYEA